MQKQNSDLELVSKKKNKKKPGFLKVILIIFATIVLLYLGAALVSQLWSNLSTTVANKGSVSESVRVDGYVFREQSIINAQWSGHFESLVSEGERVKQGQVIGYIYQTKPDADTIDRIKKIHKILRYSHVEGDFTTNDSETGAGENRISALSRNLSDIRQDCDLSAALEKKEDIDMLMRITDSSESQSYTKEQYRAELSSLEIKAGESAKVVADRGGVFSANIDGLEERLAYKNAEGQLPSTIKELDDIKATVSNTIEAGKPLCKIVNNYLWKYAAVIDKDLAEKLKIGQTVQMSFYDLASVSIEGTVTSISQEENGKCVMVISTDKYVDGIFSSSKVSADIITVNTSGIKLPVDSIRVKDGVTGVYVVRLDVATFVPINLLYRNEVWAIVSPAESLTGERLKVYDEVIVECKNLEDGKIVR